MPSTIATGDGFDAVVEVDGPENATVVVVLGAAQQGPAAYDAICRRLHTAALRTVVIAADPRLSPKSVVAVLDTLGVRWAILVGDRKGAELAWELAATRLDRFTGLVVIDRGHPEDCPPVEINTTVLVTTSAARSAAQSSQRYVYGELRVVEMTARRSAEEATAQVAAEIVMRSSTW
ncbi:pimeloyl-ACP methyl ester carboxylesterase [Mycobacterium sp. MAA66]|uniref:alpha/beta fold hydrolase n=1 Tax=Mycobacterium sp. MAA66 TaxID=3156297 RepID=UPI003512E353